MRAVPNLVFDLVVDRVDLVDEGANSEAFIKLYKRKENTMSFEEIMKSIKAEHIDVINAEIAKAKSEVPESTVTELAKAKQDVENAIAELAKAKTDMQAAMDAKNKLEEELACKGCGDSKEEDVLKNLDPAVQDIVKSLKADKLAAEMFAKQLNDQKVQAEAIAKAKELKAIPVEESKLIEIVKGASPEILEVLKAASDIIENSPSFSEVGKSKGSDSSDAWSKIEKKASEYKVADSTLTVQQSLSKAIKENPDLYREYLNGGAK